MAQENTQVNARTMRRLYLPTLVIAGLAAWLSWRGWTALGQSTANAMDASRYQLAGPVMLGFLALLITRHGLVALGAAALMAGTMVGFVLARTVGIFGFRLTFSSGLAWTVLTVEAAGVIFLLLTASLLWRQRPH